MVIPVPSSITSLTVLFVLPVTKASPLVALETSLVTPNQIPETTVIVFDPRDAAEMEIVLWEGFVPEYSN